MERFIASILATFFGCVMDLKSSMERFIDSLNALLDNPHHYLKSSMERFIDTQAYYSPLNLQI